MLVNLNKKCNYPQFNGNLNSRFAVSAKKAGEALSKSDIVKNALLNIEKYADDATEFTKEWHSTFTVSNYKLKNAEIEIDTKVPARLYPGDINSRIMSVMEYFTPQKVEEAEALLFKDYLNKTGFTENPYEALKALKGKVKDSVYKIYENIVKIKETKL